MQTLDAGVLYFALVFGRDSSSELSARRELSHRSPPGQPNRWRSGLADTSLMLSHLTVAVLMLDIETHGRRAEQCRDRVARAHFRSAGYQTAQPERPLGCESKARRNACT